jgi:hypothetical protein
MKFGTAFQNVPLIVNRQIRIDSIIKPTGVDLILNPAKNENRFRFECDNEDECDHRFVFDHMEWLMDANHKEPAFAIQPLLIGQDNNADKNNNYQLVK